jgi:phage terminase large subunit GpA-like protein
MMPAGMVQAQAVSLFPVVMLTPGEVAVFRKRERLSISRWAKKHRVVTDGPWQGPWKNEHTPHLTEPMDTWGLVGVREVTLVAPPQGGKTQVLYNCWAYGQDQEQAAAMMVMADQTTAGTIAQDRLIPILRSSPRLRDNLTESPLDLGKERLRLRGSITYLAWATSVARLAKIGRAHV